MPKKAFYIAQDTPNVSPKLGPVRDGSSGMFPFSTSSLPALPGPRGMHLPRPIRRPKQILYLAIIFTALYWVAFRHGLGGESTNVSPTPLGFAPANGHRLRPRTMMLARNGIASLLPLRRGAQPEHPFYELMERGEETWRLIRDRQSRTLDAAVAEYQRRYGMDPPAGFDKWFEWSRARGVELVDEYDLMMRDVLAHHALEPAIWIQRSLGLVDVKHTYTFNISQDHDVIISGDRAKSPRPKKIATMIDGFRKDLPKGFKLRMTGSDHDVSANVLGKDQRKRAMELVQAGDYLTETEIKHFENPRRTPAYGWFKACALDSPAARRPEAATYDEGTKPFIHDHVATMDFCEFPQLKQLHGALSHNREDRSPSVLKPWFVHSKIPGDASFLLPPIEGFKNRTAKDIPALGMWADKLDPRVHWRGSATGGYAPEQDWHNSHRIRLHMLFNGKRGNDTDWAESTREVLVPDGKGGYEKVVRTAAELAEYGDVKLTGKAIQCTEPECTEIAEQIEFGPVLTPKNTWMFRYMLDVDGNGWSERFHRLLSSASPVLKMTIFADWHMDRLVPWYHYIPILPDYSDLYDVLSFFIGPIKEDGTVDHSKGHDYLGRKIGAAGQDFALNQWRWVDMQSYTYRLFLELQRLQSMDRKAASYRHVPAETPEEGVADIKLERDRE